MVEVAVGYRGRVPADKLEEFLASQEKLTEDEDTASVQVSVLNDEGTQTVAHYYYANDDYVTTPTPSDVPDSVEEVGNDTPTDISESSEVSPTGADPEGEVEPNGSADSTQ